MSSVIPSPRTFARRAVRGATTLESLIAAAPRMVSSLDNMDMLVNRMNAAMPQVVRTVDQVEALATSLNAAMPQVTLSEEGRTLLAKVVGGTPCAFAAMPRVGPTLEYAEGMGQIARDEQTHEETS